MRPFDAVFLALAFDQFERRPRLWWLAGLAPIVAYLLQVLLDERFQLPLTALLVLLIAGRSAAIAMLLATPTYADWVDVSRTALLWLGLAVPLPMLYQRLEEEELPERVRGIPVRLVCIAVLYYTLLPVAYS